MPSLAPPLQRLGDFSLYRVVTDPPYYENCYIARRESDATMVVIDPGSAAPRILETLELLGGSVSAILLTHGHFDHVTALAEITEHSQAPVYAHANEDGILNKASDWGMALLNQPVTLPAITFFEGEPTLDVLGGIRTVATPGHTPGGVCYVIGGSCKDPCMAVTGDTLFERGRGRTDLPGGDEATLFASIARFLASEHEETTLFPGHGNFWIIREARLWWSAMTHS